MSGRALVAKTCCARVDPQRNETPLTVWTPLSVPTLTEIPGGPATRGVTISDLPREAFRDESVAMTGG